MTKIQWILRRQKHSETPWEVIRQSGWDAVPCDCEKEGCLGWRLARVKHPESPLPDGPLRAA